MIIVIAQEKGGVGKTTIATNIAAISAATSKVLLIDHDTSHVSANFHSRRSDELKQFILSMPKNVDEMVEQLELSAYDVIVVDLGGFTDDLAKAALVYADKIIVPTSTSTQDMDGNIHFMETIAKLRLAGMDTDVFYVANNTDPRMKAPRIAEELDYITEKGFELIATIPHYAAFSTSQGEGKSIVEFGKNKKAAAAMENLVAKILEHKDEQ